MAFFCPSVNFASRASLAFISLIALSRKTFFEKNLADKAFFYYFYCIRN